MRVHERGVGETRSCGTGTVAAAVAALAHQGAATGTLEVCIPGGEVTVTITDASSYLRGPSVLVGQRRAVRGMVACAAGVNSDARSRIQRAPFLLLMTFPDFPINGTPSAGELALEDRTALRRVAGLSTELTDISEVEYRQLRLERVVLVGVWTEGSAADADASLAELAALAETAGSEVLEGLIQRRDKPDPSTYIGSGKAPGTARRRRWRPAPTPSSATAN